MRAFPILSQRAAYAALALVPEDVPIDLGVIATSRSGRTNVAENRQTVGRYKRKLPARYESAVLHNPYLGCKHNVKEVPLAWQQLQFFAIYCYLTGSPHDKGN